MFPYHYIFILYFALQFLNYYFEKLAKAIEKNQNISIQLTMTIFKILLAFL